jgi:glycosyltransferase involved in cell wall biosynthesis
MTLRIAHFLNHTRRSNGHVHVAVDLACMQAKMGHEVSIISAGGDFDELLARYGVRHVILDQRRTPWNIARALIGLNGVLRKMRPDIIHAHMMTSTVLAAALRPFHRFKLVTTVHNEFDRGAILMALGDRVIAVSGAVRDSMARRGAPRARLRVVLNGTIGSPRLDEAKPAPEALPRPAVTFVGGLHPRKGIDDLINAFKLVAAQEPTSRLNIVGAGPHDEIYRGLAAESGFGDRIAFFGYSADPRKYLLGSDIFVLASHADPAPLVVAEARDCGCAIIATDVDGIPEMLEGGRAGLLVPSKNPEALSAALLKVLRDPALLRDLRERAGQNLAYFTVQRACDDCLAIYREALAA